MNLFRPLRTLFGKKKLEQDMAEEMRFHLEQRAADQQADGLSAEEARYAAERRFGNVASLQEQAREGRGWRWLENLAVDVRLGCRALLKSPGFSLLAVVTLGLGIGINTGMFSAFNSILLRPLPYDQPAQLDRLYRATPQNPEGNFSAADFRDLRPAIGRYGDVAAYAVGDAGLADPGRPAEMATAARVTANFFPLLGTTLQIGRNFRPAEEPHGNDRVVTRGRYAGGPKLRVIGGAGNDVFDESVSGGTYFYDDADGDSQIVKGDGTRVDFRPYKEKRNKYGDRPLDWNRIAVMGDRQRFSVGDFLEVRFYDPVG